MVVNGPRVMFHPLPWVSPFVVDVALVVWGEGFVSSRDFRVTNKVETSGVVLRTVCRPRVTSLSLVTLVSLEDGQWFGPSDHFLFFR